MYILDQLHRRLEESPPSLKTAPLLREEGTPMSAKLTPVFQACPPRHPDLTGSSYAADLHRAIRNEVATPQGALEFFRGTYPAPAMKTACRMVFDRLHNGDASEQPAVYRFNSRYGGGKTHTLITLAAACLHPDVVRQEPEETPIPSSLATDSDAPDSVHGRKRGPPVGHRA